MDEREANWDNRLECAELSDIGMRRANNQDSKMVRLANDEESWNDRGHFFMVADGMGAHAAGELASQLAVDGVTHLYFKYTEFSPLEALRKAMVETNSEVHRRGQANTDFLNMGTTASSLLLLPQGAIAGHIGDSRVYRLRDQQLEQLTRDHSLVWELKAAGHLTDGGDLAQTIPSNVITRSLGPSASVDVDFEGPWPIALDDVFLLCSDGLTGKVEDEELATILSYLSPPDAASLLVDLANLRGGPDNITVIVVKVANSDMVTNLSGNRVMPKRAEKQRAPTSPVVGVGVAVCLLIALVLVITDRFFHAFSASILAILVYFAGLLAARRGDPRVMLAVGGQRFGQGPYSRTSCSSPQDATELLSRITQNLRQCDPGEAITLDWSRFDARCDSATKSEQSGRADDAIRGYARAIRELMEQVRAARNKQASDSAIDY